MELLKIQESGSHIVIGEEKIPAIKGLSRRAFFGTEGDGQHLVIGLESEVKTQQFDLILGELVCHRFLACARNKLWWMTPAFGN